MTNSTETRRLGPVVALATALLVVCHGGNLVYGQSGDSQPRDLFIEGAVLEVDLDLAEADWDLLRSEGLSMPDLFAGCVDRDYEYTHVEAEVSVDGERVSAVAVRKKGFLGSLSMPRPSLKLDFGRDDHDGRTLHGTRRLTLNNNRQDPSNAKQCVAYELLALAGLPVPRCSLAHVSVNGLDKGFYTNVEPVKKPFLLRVFGDDEGNLYEAAIADFTAEQKERFELKTNNKENDRSDLDRVERALAMPDERFVEALGEVFDFDELITFWAMEVLTGHWDGMTGNQNNTFIYHDPTDDRFHPIPWGTDGSFQRHLLIPDVPESVFAFNSLSARLYSMPETRVIFQKRLRELLDEVWDEERIVARFRTIVEQTEGNVSSLDTIEEYVRGRRSAIEEELASNSGKGPEITTSRVRIDSCREPVRASGIIDFTWNDDPEAFRPVEDVDALEINIPLPDVAVRFVPGEAVQLATLDAGGSVSLTLIGSDSGRGEQVLVNVVMPAENYQVGEVPFHGVETMAIVLQLSPDDGDPTILGFVGRGTVTFTEVGRQNGEPVRGHWEGFLAPFGAPPSP